MSNMQDKKINEQGQKPEWAKMPVSATTAGLLGIFLGIFGVHNFYLGEKKKGITHLALFGGGLLMGLIAPTTVSLGGGNSFGMIMSYFILYGMAIGNWVWGLVEGIKILARGDAGLVEKGYNIVGLQPVQSAKPVQPVQTRKPEMDYMLQSEYIGGRKKKSATAAGVMGMLLGFTGAHDFYIGEIGKGVSHFLAFLAGVIVRIMGSMVLPPDHKGIIPREQAALIGQAEFVGNWLILGSWIWGFIEGVLILNWASRAAKGKRIYNNLRPGDSGLAYSLVGTIIGGMIFGFIAWCSGQYVVTCVTGSAYECTMASQGYGWGIIFMVPLAIPIWIFSGIGLGRRKRSRNPNLVKVLSILGFVFSSAPFLAIFAPSLIISILK
ncbi:MAG: TM2 domain-containing protein [Candidatus Saccharibacteria bacterium]|nr:TM2 domain-containing protein [Candidatus Saccharibacteria bacterium]